MTSTTALNTKTSVFRWGSRAPLLALSLVVVLIDRFSKFLVDRNLRPGSAITGDGKKIK